MTELTIHLFVVVAIVAAGSGLQHGYNVGALNTAADIIKAWIVQQHQENYGSKLSDVNLALVWSTVTSIYNLGGLIGAFLVATIIKTTGSRKGLVYNNVILLLGVVCEFAAVYARHYELVIIGRFIVGINNGVSSGICPIFLCDLAPKNLRGSMGTTYQVCVVTGFLVVSLTSLDSALGSSSHWNFMLALPVIPAVLQTVVLLIYVPESPRHLLLIREDDDGALKVLRWLRGREANIEEEIFVMRQEQERIKALPKVTLREFQHEELLRKPLIVLLVVILGTQMCGMTSIGFFSSYIFVQQAGLPHTTMEYANIGLAITRLIYNVLTMAYLVEKFGRKPLLIASFAGMGVAQICLMISLMLNQKAHWIPYMSIFSLIIHVIAHSIGASTIPKFIAAEMFPQNAKPIAQSISGGIRWTLVFLTVLLFSPLADLLGYYVFIIFIVSNVLTTVYIVFNLPETKMKTLAQVQAYFHT